MIDVPDGCTLVTEPFWPHEDTWPPGTLYKSAIMAYRMLADRRQITIERVFYNRSTDVTRFKYLALEPEQQLRQQFEQAVDDACEILRAEYERRNCDGNQKGMD